MEVQLESGQTASNTNFQEVNYGITYKRWINEVSASQGADGWLI